MNNPYAGCSLLHAGCAALIERWRYWQDFWRQNMKNAQLISRWKRCEGLAEKLGMAIGTNHTEMLSAQGREGEGHKSFYACETVDELLGYLEGITDAKTKMTNAKPYHAADSDGGVQKGQPNE